MMKFVAGKWVNQGYYRAFIPNPVNRKWEISDPEIIHLLSKADIELGRLDAFSGYVNIDLFISMHLTKEAVESNRIEGTRTEFAEAFMHREELPQDRRQDWEEVTNYIAAMKHSINRLTELPISSRLIREAHGMLLAGVRGQHKMPGEFRNSQNWIGGASISDAVFVPPPAGEVGRLLSDLEYFANDQEHPLPDLLRAAILHYQFETIHPFLDGNGRVGRLLITLYLISTGTLRSPVLYLSDFFERNRRLYYDNLSGVHAKNDLKQWLRFFLVGVAETARDGIRTFDGILKLSKSVDATLLTLGRKAEDARIVMDALYLRPVITITEAAELIGKSENTSSRLLQALQEIDILQERPTSGREKLFEFKDYLELFSSKR
ncbi:Fic family protein [Lewinella sp. IMCC34183]|uniref:Fic family protein n=1 Tax=Lewinella sp. IMCC34183 TaxID=2248762 RepID=UPI000E24E2B6|nr:Fic family protein [Lewinella sp. IMCC34183]